MNDNSVLRRKRRAFERTKTLARDPETREIVGPSQRAQLLSMVKAPFTYKFWAEKFEPTDDETLVDGPLLSYSYLEAGMIEMIGALVAYFVVFYQAGFSPYDLRTAQQSQS